MGKFSAIEARATQYPASTNDVVWLVERLRGICEASAALLDTRAIQDHDGGYQGCDACQAVTNLRAALSMLNAPNVPGETP